MKNSITIFFTFVLVTSLNGQWVEYLSHEKQVTDHHEHFLYQGQTYIGISNNYYDLERIDGNTPKESVFEGNFQYQSKSTITGIDEKEILLVSPFDFDIDGWGAVSLRLKEGELSINKITPENHDNFTRCRDAIIPADTSQHRECLEQYGDRYIFNAESELLEFHEEDQLLSYHQGTQGEFYHIFDNNLGLLQDEVFFQKLTISEDAKLYNDPYRNQLVVYQDSLLSRYDYNNFQLLETHSFETEPLHFVFAANGLFYISEASDGFTVYRIAEEGTASFWYNVPPAPTGQDFNLTNFDINGTEIYVFGLYEDELTKTHNSVIQKFNLLGPQAPVRNNLAIKSANIEQFDVMYGYDYTYEIVVKNEGLTHVEYFDLYSDLTGYNEFLFTNIDESYEGNLAPGDSVLLSGEFFESFIDRINISIPGSDFMFDALPIDNSMTVFIETSSQNDLAQENITLYPNPTSGILNVSGIELNNVEVTIYNLLGQAVKSGTIRDGDIDVSDLKNGQYWLSIQSQNGFYSKAFHKL